jgi:peptidoglycan/xylan/chitin deacetylase (PgdA/CDA1 family)
MVGKSAVRFCLHSLGGLALLRRMHRREFRVLMFHAFPESDRANVETICGHLARHFEPVSLSTIVDAIESGKPLPDNALTVTIDDGYKSYLTDGHPVFRRHRIPVTMFAVAGFSDGRLWLWPDQVRFCLEHTARTSLRAELGPGKTFDLDLSSAAAKSAALDKLLEALKTVPNHTRLTFIAGLGPSCGVELPAAPPPRDKPMTWDELRAAASDGVEIGCHTETHPILSRIPVPELDREIKGAKALMEQRLGFPVHHFCYPNGRSIDIGPDAVACVRAAGFRSAVTTTWGLNTPDIDLLSIRRVPFDSSLSPRYGAETLAGLHMSNSAR